MAYKKKSLPNAQPIMTFNCTTWNFQCVQCVIFVCVHALNRFNIKTKMGNFLCPTKTEGLLDAEINSVVKYLLKQYSRIYYTKHIKTCENPCKNKICY